MRDKTKALALLGSMVLLGAASVHSLRQEKSERNNNYNENLRYATKAVELAHGTNGIIPLSQAQNFLESIGFDYKLKDDDIGVTLRPYLHDRSIQVSVIRTNPFSNVYVGFQNYMEQVSRKDLSDNWINKRNTNSPSLENK